MLDAIVMCNMRRSKVGECEEGAKTTLPGPMEARRLQIEWVEQCGRAAADTGHLWASDGSLRYQHTMLVDERIAVASGKTRAGVVFGSHNHCMEGRFALVAAPRRPRPRWRHHLVNRVQCLRDLRELQSQHTIVSIRRFYRIACRNLDSFASWSQVSCAGAFGNTTRRPSIHCHGSVSRSGSEGNTTRERWPGTGTSNAVPVDLAAHSGPVAIHAPLGSGTGAYLHAQ